MPKRAGQHEAVRQFTFEIEADCQTFGLTLAKIRAAGLELFDSICTGRVAAVTLRGESRLVLACSLLEAGITLKIFALPVQDGQNQR